ncbi:MAG: hypothetical protein GXP42_17660 [Chloroflexi bacterium]|nr:hypothetical protein [Chloroflexota bacterium]
MRASVVSAQELTRPQTNIAAQKTSVFLTIPSTDKSKTGGDFPPISDAVYGDLDGVQYIQIPTTECTNLTATPIVVNEWLVYPMHDYGFNCDNGSPYRLTLFGYNMIDGLLYDLSPTRATGEATLLYRPEEGVVYWNVTKVVGHGTVLVLDDATFTEQRRLSVGMSSDASGVYLDGLYYFGTVNTPNEFCQEPINPNCGALFAADSDGVIVEQLNTDDGFRSWVGAGITTDGNYLYVGGSPQTLGEDKDQYLYGCTVVKLDKELNIVAAFDPGEQGCFRVPYTGLSEDAVGGEPVLGAQDDLWVQYVRPNDDSYETILYRLNKDLQELCRVAFEFRLDLQTAAFYAAPTVDKEGNVYAPITLPVGEDAHKAALYRIAPDCRATLLVEVSDSYAYATPTLADDRYALFATDGRLGVYTLDGSLVAEYALASNARVLAGPVIHEGVIYVVQEDGTINVIAESGVSDYGTAVWPRYRRDNFGSATLGQDATVPASVIFLPAMMR